MAQKYQELSDKIVGLVGGKANVQFFTHCVTRLRFNVKDESAVKKDEIEKLPGVLGSQWQNGQYQIIIGQAVNDAYRLICEKNGFAVEKSVDEKLDDEKPAQKKGVKAVIDKIFDGISGSLTPLIPALIGCGMIKVILILMDMAGVPADSGTYQLLTFAGDAGFYFLPIMIGAFAAKKFGANPALGMVIGGLLIYPSFASGVSDGTAFNFLGIPVYGVGYSSTIFPIILCCAVMAPIEKFFAKHSPDILRSVLEPLLTIIVMIPLAYCVLGPIGSFLGTYLSTFVLWLYNTLGFIGVAAFAAVMPFVIMTGMHGAFVPYLMQMLTVDPLYEPIFFQHRSGHCCTGCRSQNQGHQPEVHRLLHRCHRCCGRCYRACHVRHQPEVQDPHVRRHDRFCHRRLRGRSAQDRYLCLCGCFLCHRSATVRQR